jgi:hypothetical protein
VVKISLDLTERISKFAVKDIMQGINDRKVPVANSGFIYLDLNGSAKVPDVYFINFTDAAEYVADGICLSGEPVNISKANLDVALKTMLLYQPFCNPRADGRGAFNIIGAIMDQNSFDYLDKSILKNEGIQITHPKGKGYGLIPYLKNNLLLKVIPNYIQAAVFDMNPATSVVNAAVENAPLD